MTHLLTTKNPQTEARRNAVHGPLQPAERPDDKMTLRQCALMVGVLSLSLWLVIGGIIWALVA